MLNQTLSLTKDLISIKSTSSDFKALDKALSLVLSKLQGYTIEHFDKEGYKSVLIYKSKKRPKKFRVILNGHLDVIPGKDHQNKPFTKADRLYGLGALDMKASLACLITVFKDVSTILNYPLGLQIVTDEEVGGFYGTKYQINQGIRADFVIAGEATNFRIINKTKGVLWVNISSKGKTAHGAYPWKGENSILEINKFLTQLLTKYPLPKKEEWATTVNISHIGTNNQTFNKIPDNCQVSIDIRYLPEESKTIIKNIKSLLSPSLKMEIIANEPPLNTNDKNLYIQKLRKAANKILGKKISLSSAHGSSDARHYTAVNNPGIEFGPIGSGIGSDDEWISIKSLEKYSQIMREFLINLNNS